MAEYQVTGVTKTKKQCDCITHLCGLGFNKTVADIIADIDFGNRYYTDVGGAKAYVEVVRVKPPYVRTEKDDKTEDNLLSLPACK